MQWHFHPHVQSGWIPTHWSDKSFLHAVQKLLYFISASAPFVALSMPMMQHELCVVDKQRCQQDLTILFMLRCVLACVKNLLRTIFISRNAVFSWKNYEIIFCQTLSYNVSQKIRFDGAWWKGFQIWNHIKTHSRIHLTEKSCKQVTVSSPTSRQFHTIRRRSATPL